MAGVLWFFGVIPVPRGRVPLGAIRMALSHLARGGIVGVFPEGTRSASFGEIPPRRGAAWLATRLGVPLVPLYLEGTGQVMGLDNKLRPGRIQITVGPPLVGEDSWMLTQHWQDWIDSQTAKR